MEDSDDEESKQDDDPHDGDTPPPPMLLPATAKAKPTGRRRVPAPACVVDRLTYSGAVSKALVMQMLTPLGCTEASTKEDFQLLSAKDIADVLQTQEMMQNSTPMDRAKLFEQCRCLSVSWGCTFARSFHVTGPEANN